MIRKSLLAISLLLLAGTVGLWVVSYWWRVGISISLPDGVTDAYINNAHLNVVTEKYSICVRETSGFHYGYEPASDWYHGASFKWSNEDFGFEKVFRARLPLWFCALFPAACVVVLGSAWLLRRNESQSNHCRACGYDLTGNVSGVCPECGTAKPAAASARTY
jgi:hypothetical protein